MLTVEVPTRDGTILRGLRYQPETPQAPVVLSITPYGADRFHPDGTGFAARGFTYVTLDSRGRGDSDGMFEPFVNDGADGHDAVEWIARQPWCTGDVVLHGGSYGGFVQWAIAATRPPALRGIAPVASVYPGYDFPMVRNVPTFYAIRWLTLLDGHRMNNGPFADAELWAGAARDIAAGNHSYRELDLLTLGRRHRVLQEWLDHPSLDAYWRDRAPRAEVVDVPVLTITGQYDDDQQGALRYYAEHPGDRHDLVIGPWDHGGTRTAATRVGGLTFADESSIDLRALHADWYDWVLDRGDRPEFLADRVTYFHIGADRWRSAPALPAGTPYTYPVRGAGRDLVLEPAYREIPGLTDPLPDDAIVLTGDALPQVVELTGRIQVDLVLNSGLPDFDLLISAYVLAPEPVLLGDTVLRARYRDSLTVATPWPKDRDTTVTVELPFLSRRLAPGEQIAIAVAPTHSRYQPNRQSGGIITAEQSSTTHAGAVTIQHATVRLPTT